ncbi:MAG: hypothetical protein ABIS06_13055 [Vicinamibacterales bacterium]
MTTIDVLRALEDRPLLDAAKRLAKEERRATAALLRTLMEIDSRRLYLGEGCASMFAYCTQVLHLAEGAAYNRIEAARAAREYPLVLELFEQSAITLTAVRLLAPHLTATNHVAVLASAQHRSKREIEMIVAALRPRPDAPVVVRRLPPPKSDLPDAVIADPAAGTPSAGATPASTAAGLVARLSGQARVEPPAAVVPLAPERYRIQLTVSRETHDRFRRAQSLLRHAVPSGDAAEIFDRAIALLVERLERQRFASTSKPGDSTQAAERSRHIPAVVRRAVWRRRDDERCAFVGAAGRCRESAFLEFHHVEPFAAGGEPNIDNIQLRCGAHNADEARLFYGHGVVREAGRHWTCS